MLEANVFRIFWGKNKPNNVLCDKNEYCIIMILMFSFKNEICQATLAYTASSPVKGIN